jgi:hypothetical protein
MSYATRWTWTQGSKVISEWRRSGLSMSAFARKRGLNTERLRYWRDRVDAEGLELGVVRSTRRPADEQRFVPGFVVGLGNSSLCVRLPRGVMVEAANSADIEPSWLARLVVALEEA